MKKNQRSLMFKLMIWINLVSILVIVSLSGAIMKSTMDRTEVMLAKEMETLVNSVKLTSADYVWNLNNEVLKTITIQLTGDPAIEFVEFRDNKKKVITSAKKEKAANKTGVVSKIPHKSFSSDIIYGADKQVIGEIELQYNLNKVQLVKEEFTKMTLIGVIIAEIIMCFILFILLRSTTNNLGIIAQKLRSVSKKNQLSSETVQNISESVSQSTHQQASSIQETVSTLDEIGSMVNTSVESAEKSASKAQESHRIANEGKDVVKEMILSMEEINKSNKDIMDEIQKSNERIAGIVNVINEISQKTSIINDIVFQTKLLSFNASVEAARAGEHGKGFAVVAEEVGNLAQMSGTASNEISQMLGESINRVNDIINETNRNIQHLIEDGNNKVKGGVLIANRCGKVLNEVVDNAMVVKGMMHEVSLACKEQAEGVKNISLAMNQLDQTTLNNANTANLSFQSSKELAVQAEELQESVKELEREIFGGKGHFSNLNKKNVKPKEKPKKEDVKSENSKSKNTDSSSSSSSNVLSIKKGSPKSTAVTQIASSNPSARRKNSNALELPHSDDPRFEDV